MEGGGGKQYLRCEVKMRLRGSARSPEPDMGQKPMQEQLGHVTSRSSQGRTGQGGAGEMRCM